MEGRWQDVAVLPGMLLPCIRAVGGVVGHRIPFGGSGVAWDALGYGGVLGGLLASCGAVAGGVGGGEGHCCHHAWRNGGRWRLGGKSWGLGKVRLCMGEEGKKKHNLPRPIVCSSVFTGVARRHMDELSLPRVTVVALTAPLMLVRRWWSMQGSTRTGTHCVGILI
jgi:hypothetical protein